VDQDRTPMSSPLRRGGFLKTLKTNLASARHDPGILAMGVLNTLLPAALVTCLAVALAQLAGGVSRGQLLAAAVAAAVGIVLWAITTLVGIAQYQAQIVAKRDIDELLGLTETLQSAESYDDTATVLMATSLELLPELGGALYVFNNSRDRLDLVGSWNIPADYSLSEILSPANCWALKRGKPQINRPNSPKLRCLHHSGDSATLEVPMVARGSVYGLLVFVTEHEAESTRRFAEVTRLVEAMADAMSLALSNIALREKLRTQSLRDPLTGLYNRRYMEDALERYVNLAERNGAQTSVVLLDLDNFKRLNDEHGHAKGDAVLRDVAVQLVGGLRPSDVVCRYGGEEIIAILPDCGLDDAMLKAEALRLRVEALSEVHGLPISASFGVAAIPETSTTSADLVAMADSALYLAKSGGKNRVAKAAPRAASGDGGPRLAVAAMG
jgi:diguanylate cyclase (GGDEF)-like protein